ncbi:hypothetical protein [Rhizobium tumorigenes]|uniref:Uncharacterized protein n=1 Tax=Rhizobium tumorigenes TaxID=2041385 RepID=A0AAF1K4Q4_9HYPH|nr:hypothetical protein [Rhizobium tumorigenes]WFR95714.1 hypothetical protein PR017_00755 [Rhizobium tumorigenes]
MNNANMPAQTNISLPHPIIVLGRDDHGKAHASYFAAPDGHLAKKAAALMGMLALRVDNDGVRAFLPRLPKGKLFDSGKAFVPFVKQDLYREIALHLPVAEQQQANRIRVVASDDTAAAGPQGQPVRPTALPEDFTKLKVGNLVLATDGPMDGWYEALVLEIKPDQTVRVRWRDYLDIPPFGRRVEQLALIHPSYIEK